MDNKFELHHGDCLEVLRGMPDNSVDSIVTDPPYGLSFMGRKWDYDVPSVEIWAECLRVLKPGGHLLAFAGTRTQHRMAVRIEDAGFEIRDMIAWVYGSGFPKSHNVGKSIDREAGAEREVVGKVAAGSAPLKRGHVGASGGGLSVGTERSPEYDITEPATAAARQWQGWGTALKPALEPITVARKPLIGTVAANVLAHGTGALNIDGCRVATDDGLNGGRYSDNKKGEDGNSYGRGINERSANNYQQPAGRWPANFLSDGSEEVLAGFPITKSGGGDKRGGCQFFMGGDNRVEPTKHEPNSGSAARFFYCAKASKKDRNEGCEHIEEKQYSHDGRTTPIENAYQSNSSNSSNSHPTVKPTALMAYLCRLVTPPNGIVLDPFMGSGSTGKAAMREGFRFIGIERESEYLQIARARIEYELRKAE